VPGSFGDLFARRGIFGAFGSAAPGAHLSYSTDFLQRVILRYLPAEQGAPFEAMALDILHQGSLFCAVPTLFYRHRAASTVLIGSRHLGR